MNAREFLAELWTDEPGGHIQLWEIATKRSAYIPRPSVIGDTLDGATDIYTGVGLAPEPLGPHVRAKADQVVGIAGLWLDIDIDGPGRKSDGVPDEMAAVWLAEAILPATLLVDSGYGIHAWHLFGDGPWLFDTAQARKRAGDMAWQWYALHRAYCEGRGWTLGGTHDLARLLRIPGTMNGKHGRSVPVRVIATGPRHNRRVLARLCAEAGIPEPPPTAGELDLNFDGAPDWLGPFLGRHPGVQKAFHHDPEHPGWSLSEWDLALATRAADHLADDSDLAALIAAHRIAHGDDKKARRRKYLADTIARARSRY